MFLGMFGFGIWAGQISTKNVSDGLKIGRGAEVVVAGSGWGLAVFAAGTHFALGHCV